MKTTLVNQCSEAVAQAADSVISKVEEIRDARVDAINEVAPILEHWYSLVVREQFTVQEFYDSIEREMVVQNLPGLTISRVDLSEGGILSDKREYLRMKREQLYFDICAAPVGKNFFFSYRFYDRPVNVKPWEIVILIVVILLLLQLSVRFIGIIAGPLLLVTACCFFVWTMRNAIGLGLRDIDTTLQKLPVIGSIYIRYFRKDTYYRQDTRIAYCSIVSGIVKQQVETVTAAKGVTLLREYLYSPAFGDIYTMKQTVPRKPGEDAEVT